MFQVYLPIAELSVNLAVMLGLGAAVGLAVPATERENEWLGEARDSLMEQAKDVISEAGEQARRTAGEALEQDERRPEGQRPTS
jgi:hypothetical protein